MILKINAVTTATITTNRSLTIDEAMYAIGYDVSSEEDCKRGYENGLECFYMDDDGRYCFDADAVEIASNTIRDIITNGGY